MHYLDEQIFNLSPGILIDKNGKLDYIFDVKFYETRSLSIETILQKHIESAQQSGLTTISYCFYQIGYRLLNFESLGVYETKANMFSALFDFVYDRRDWGGCVTGHLGRRIIDFQMKISPEVGLSFLKLGDNFSRFGDISDRTSLGLDLQLNTMAGIIIYDMLLLDVRYDVKPFISNNSYILNRELTFRTSLNFGAPLNYDEDQVGITIFADYTSSTHEYGFKTFTDFRTNIGMRIYNMFYYSRWLVDAINETRELIY